MKGDLSLDGGHEEHQGNEEVFDLLGVEDGKLTITGFQIGQWGKDLTLECTYEGDRSGTFQLVFEDCRSIQWDMHAEVDEADTTAEAIGMFLGEENHGESAIIYTDLFEISVFYGSMMIVKSW